MGNTCFRPSPVKVDPSFTSDGSFISATSEMSFVSNMSEVSFTSDDGRRSEVKGREMSDTEIEQKISSVLHTFKRLGQKQDRKQINQSVLYA